MPAHERGWQKCSFRIPTMGSPRPLSRPFSVSSSGLFDPQGYSVTLVFHPFDFVSNNFVVGTQPLPTLVWLPKRTIDGQFFPQSPNSAYLALPRTSFYGFRNRQNITRFGRRAAFEKYPHTSQWRKFIEITYFNLHKAWKIFLVISKS